MGVDAGRIAGLILKPRDSIFSVNEKRKSAANKQRPNGRIGIVRSEEGMKQSLQ